MARVFRVTDQSLGCKLMVHHRPPSLLSDLYGLRKGHQCVKVGDLEWPAASGKQLLDAFQVSKRPVFMVFVGREWEMEPPEETVKPQRMRMPGSPLSSHSSWTPMSSPMGSSWGSPPGSPSGALVLPGQVGDQPVSPASNLRTAVA